MLILRFAVMVPLKRYFDYLAPQDSAIEVLQSQIGCRFMLPFGFRQTIGILLSLESKTDVPEHKIKAISHCLDRHPILNPALLQLGEWISHYYHAPPGDVFFTMLPPSLRTGREITPEGYSFQLTNLGREKLNQLSSKSKHKNALAQLFLTHAPVFPIMLSNLNCKYHSSLKQFLNDQWVEKKAYDLQEQPRTKYDLPKSSILNAAQSQVVQTMLEQGLQFKVSLLEGVTGSGKTEVYLEIAKQHLRQGRQVLILVPEIGLTPQFLARTQKHLGISVLGIHSQLTDKKRFEAWQAARLNQVQLIIGTRSALFTPLPYLGIIIIDEEHDASYRARDGLRFSAKDSAIMYAKHLNIPILLGSATPSLESLNNGLTGRFTPLFLSERAIGRIPEWQLIHCLQHPPVI